MGEAFRDLPKAGEEGEGLVPVVGLGGGGGSDVEGGTVVDCIADCEGAYC